MRCTPLTLLPLLPLLALLACGDKDTPVDSGPISDDSAADDSAADDSAADDSAADDADGDGHPAGEDCDDGDPAVFPGAEEVCDGVDNDCDGGVDQGATDAPTWTVDADGDGYGDDATAVASCEAPSGHVAEGGDCDDGDAAVHPEAEEVCDGVDNDCDGGVDQGATDAPTWHADGDGDGYGDDATAVASCEAPSGHVAEGGDCDDGDAAVHPEAEEVCDGADNDCDGGVDQGATDAPTWYADGDGDGYGDDATAVASCEAPSGHVAEGGDCDDSDAGANPDLGCDVDWSGSYAGSFDLAVTVSSLGVSDTCSGTGTLEVDTAEATPIDGSYTCAFSSTLSSLLGNQSISVSGDFDSDTDASGSLTVGSLTSGSWTGSFSGSSFSGSGSGSGAYLGYRYTWTLAFDGAR